MKPWADHDIEWGHSNSGHFVVNESTDDGEFNQNVGRCSMILPTNLLKEEKKCFVQPERRITALHWISRWLDNIWVFWRQNETEAAACTHFIYRRLMEQIG